MKRFLLSLPVLLLPLYSAVAQISTAQTSTPDAITQEIIQLEREKDKAHEQGNTAVLAKIYAEDYQAITSTGTITTKKTVLEFFPQRRMFQLYRSSEITVRVFGDVAIVTGLLKRKFYKDIKSGEESTLRYTHIYARRQGPWQIVAAHFSKM